MLYVKMLILLLAEVFFSRVVAEFAKNTNHKVKSFCCGHDTEMK